MPINITPLYTGRDSAAAFPDLDRLDDSLRRKQDLTLRGEEMRLDKTLKDRDAFMKLMEVDPVMAVSLRGQEQQAKDLEAYNNKGAEIMRRSGGRPSEADRMEMLREKALLQSKQNKILGTQKQWEEASRIMENDKAGYYDPDAYAAEYDRFLNTGEFDKNKALQVAPQSMSNYLMGIKDKLPANKVPEARTIIVNGKPTEVWGDKAIIDDDTKKNAILNGMMYDEALMKGVLNDFNTWSSRPENRQQVEQLFKTYDKNNNRRLDPEEVKYVYKDYDPTKNPIVQWATNNPDYLGVLQQDDLASKNIPGQNKPTGSGLTLNIGGRDYKYTPQPPSAHPKFSEFYPFTQGATVKIPTKDARMLDVDMKLPDSPSMDVTLTGYAKDTDEFTFMVNDSNNLTTGMNNVTIAVPAANVPDRLKDLMVIYNGKQTSIKSLIGSPSKTTTAQSTTKGGELDNL